MVHTGNQGRPPRFLSLEIGAGFTAYEIVANLPFHPTTRCIHLTVPTQVTWKGAVVWFEGVYLRDPPPLPTTNSWKAALK